MEIRFEIINTAMLWFTNTGLIQNYIILSCVTIHLISNIFTPCILIFIKDIQKTTNNLLKSFLVLTIS